MTSERVRVHIDDRTGRQISSPGDAENGGSHQLQDAEAKKWLAANPDKALVKKEAEKPEDKAVEKAENKGKSTK